MNSIQKFHSSVTRVRVQLGMSMTNAEGCKNSFSKLRNEVVELHDFDFAMKHKEWHEMWNFHFNLFPSIFIIEFMRRNRKNMKKFNRHANALHFVSPLLLLSHITMQTRARGGHWFVTHTCVPSTTICGSCMESEPTVLKTSCNLFTTGISASILYERNWIYAEMNF